MLNSEIPTASNFRIHSFNEINLANGYSNDNGYVYINYMGCEKSINMVFMEQGMGNHALTAIKVKDVYIGDVSVKTKLGI